jgi:TolB-like protein/lipoprotein NlpI
LGQFFDELKRRNVFRVAIAYLVAAWLVLQIADVVLEIIEAPAWVAQVFLLAFTLGFPFVVVFSWVYELTPEGIKREKDVVRQNSITSRTGRKLDMATIGMLVAVLLFVGMQKVLGPGNGESRSGSTPAEELSIAVLAFEDLSQEGDHAFFAEGLSEELLNLLAKVPQLQVAGRTSSFAFKGKDADLREIGELLNVAHILEGSVRKSGNRIRVTAQLIKASDGFHLYSDTYEREMSDIFDVQDDIAKSISEALLSEMIGGESIAHSAPTDPEAYELYMLARQRINSRNPDLMREAGTMLDRALQIDPLYAPALAQKALVTYLMSDSTGAYGDTPVAEAAPAARRYLDQALALNDQLAEALAIKGLLIHQEQRPEEAAAILREARDLNPSSSDTANWLSSALWDLTRYAEALELLESIIRHDPTYGPAFGNLMTEYARSGAYDRADELISRVVRIVGENSSASLARGIMLSMQGRLAEARQVLRRALDENPNASIAQMWFGFTSLSLADFEPLIEAGLPEHRMQAYYALGQKEEAYDIMASLDVRKGDPVRLLIEVGIVLHGEQASQEYLDFVHAHYESIDELLEFAPPEQSWGGGYTGLLGYAALQVGDEATFKKLMRAMRAALDTQHAKGADNWVLYWGEAQYAALTGDTEGAFENMQRALDRGHRSAFTFNSVMLAGLSDDPRLGKLQQSMAKAVDAERSKAGLGPYRPFPADGRHKRRPSAAH